MSKSDFTGICAKVCAMRANIFTEQNFNEILELSSIEDVYHYLTEHPMYKPLFKHMDEHRVTHRSQLEFILSFSYFNDFLKIYNFANGKQRQILSFLFDKFEIDILKKCLTSMNNRSPVPDLLGFDMFFNKHSNLNIDALCSATSMDEFINVLSNTPYYTVFRSLRDKGLQNVYEYKTQLDIMYYKKIWKQKKKITTKTSCEIFTDITGVDIDMQNLINMYRLKKYYNVAPKDINDLIIPIRYKLKKEELNSLINSSTLNEFINIVKNTYYGKMNFEFENIEQSHFKILNKVYKTNLRKHPSSMASVLHYFFTRANEVHALTTILECVRYDIKPKSINNYVITV